MSTAEPNNNDDWPQPDCSCQKRFAEARKPEPEAQPPEAHAQKTILLQSADARVTSPLQP